MSNEQIFSNLIAHSQTEFFVKKNPIYNTANHNFEGMFEQKNYATGGSINIKVPGYFTVQTGLVVTADAIEDLVIPYEITEDDILSVTLNLNSYEDLFNIIPSDKALTDQNKKAIVDNYGYPAYQGLAAKVETNCANQLLLNSYLTPIDGIEKLRPLNNYNAVASIDTFAEDLHLQSERYLMFNTTDSQLVFSSMQNMFNEAINTKITKTALIGGAEKGRIAGFDSWRSTSLKPHVAGPLAGVSGITVSNVSADGTQITLTGVSSVTSRLIKAGDLISIPSVYLADPIEHTQLQWRLVVKAAADANGDGAGNVQFTICYPLMASGNHQNVMALPAVGAAVDVYPTHNQNYAYTPSGLSVVALKMPPIYGAVNSDTMNKAADGQSASFPVHVTLQGATLQLSNNYRMYCMVPSKGFAPYLISIPSISV